MGMNHRPNSGKAEKISEIIGFLRILRDQLFVSKATKPSIPIDLLALLFFAHFFSETKQKLPFLQLADCPFML